NFYLLISGSKLIAISSSGIGRLIGLVLFGISVITLGSCISRILLVLTIIGLIVSGIGLVGTVRIVRGTLAIDIGLIKVSTRGVGHIDHSALNLEIIERGIAPFGGHRATTV